MAAVAIPAMAGCGWIAEVGPSHADAQAVARPHCAAPPVSLPTVIDRDVRAIRLTGRWEENVVPYLFGSPAYAYIEWELEATWPDGTRLIRYAAAGPSRDAGAAPNGNRIQACPEGVADLGSHPSAASPYRSDAPRACATMQALLEPTTRWQIRRTVEDGRQGSFRRRIITDEIVNTRDGKVLGHARRVDVEALRQTTTAAVIGVFPIVGRNHHVSAACGQTLDAANVLRLLVPSSAKRQAR